MPPPAPEPTIQTSYTFACGKNVMLESVLCLDVAHRRGLAQRCERIAGGHELVRHEPRESAVGDRRHDGVPVQLLRAVQLVAAGHAAGVEVRDPIPVVADGADDV